MPALSFEYFWPPGLTVRFFLIFTDKFFLVLLWISYSRTALFPMMNGQEKIPECDWEENQENTSEEAREKRRLFGLILTYLLLIEPFQVIRSNRAYTEKGEKRHV